MITLADVRPGDIIFGPIGGLVPGVFPVGAGQLLLADRKVRLSWRRWWKIRHVLIVTQASQSLPPGSAQNLRTRQWHPGPLLPEAMPFGDEFQSYPTGVITAPKAVQAMPRGAEEIELRQDRHWTKDYVYVRPAYKSEYTPPAVAEAARGYVGTPYNFLTYGKLAAGRLHLGLTERALKRWISTRNDQMCSQLADQCLADAGFHVFDDGRLPQDVVPAELYRKLLDMPGTQWWIPGREGEFENWPPGTLP